MKPMHENLDAVRVENELIRADRVFQAAVADELKKLPEQLLVIYGTP